MTLRPATPRALNVFFDVDGTLIDYVGLLRPHVHDVFAAIHADGHAIYVWSGRGIRRSVVDGNGLQRYVRGLFAKPLEDFRAQLPQFTPVIPDFVVDDHAEIVAALGGIVVDEPSPWRQPDREMWRAYEALCVYAQTVPPSPPGAGGPSRA